MQLYTVSCHSTLVDITSASYILIDQHLKILININILIDQHLKDFDDFDVDQNLDMFINQNIISRCYVN